LGDRFLDLGLFLLEALLDEELELVVRGCVVFELGFELEVLLLV
jgi:hypothetical protein